MDVKLVLLIFAACAFAFVSAEFFYNPVLPKAEKLDSLNLKCIRGRTIIKIKERSPVVEEQDSEEDDIYRRSHMNFGAKDDEACEICVCSTEGKDEYCSKRPAMNVNECLVMAKAKDEFNKNIPFDADRELSNRVRRRDLIYHNDEIPYPVNAKCYRGMSYYSNNPNANDTDIDVAEDIESLLDYDTVDICFYCICSTNGYYATCVSRDPFYCEYFRYLRNETSKGKTRYGKLFKQDRPTYFRQLSYRIRRTMDEGMFQLVDSFKSRQGKAGGDQQCIPYVSQYSTCTDENSCSGCKECNCDGQGQWVCQDVTKCLGMDYRELDENSLDLAWETIEAEYKKKNRENAAKYGSPHVPRPQSFDVVNDELLERLIKILDSYKTSFTADIEKEKFVGSDVEAMEAKNVREFMALQLDSVKGKLDNRHKRSLTKNNKTKDTHTVKFYHTVDELNEDTLKHTNDTGTIIAKKAVANFPPAISRRNGMLDGINSSNPLHIEYKSQLYEHHITDNKIDSIHNHDKKDSVHEKLHEMMGNKTKAMRDKDLSKIIVNELKTGIEVVGDKSSPSISNITFTRENDTLTAMAFIAGNLLNKLWNLEKDYQGDSIESEVIKHEKIADLVDLFKEPLTLRQESFLKNALEHLAGVMAKGSDDKSNIPLCEQVEKIKADLGITKNCSVHKNINKNEPATTEGNGLDETKTKGNILRTEITNDAAVEAVEKLDNVMSLIQKYEEVQKHINNIKTPSTIQEIRTKITTTRSAGHTTDSVLSDDENQTLNVYGNILEKITKLLVPNKNKHKDIVKSIKNKNIFRRDEDLKTKLKRIYDIDLDNSTFTSKDKVVLDYLINLRNSKCLLGETIYDGSLPEGGLIQNLSEFLKAKSFVDLLKLLEPEKTTSTTTTESTTYKNILRENPTETTEALITSTKETSTKKTVATTISNKGNLAQTKDKLKRHLKAIISDLVELQKATGVNTKESNMKIAEALPCLYNILNSNKLDEDEMKYQMSKIKSVFDSLKEELKFNPQTRRANMITELRPKSAAVWERVIKNTELNPKSRRHLEYNEAPNSFDEVDLLIRSTDDFKNEYKNIAISNGVSPQKRLALLKTIDVDARIYMSILEKVKQYLDGTWNVDSKVGTRINSFLDRSILNVKLDEDVLNNLYKHKGNVRPVPTISNFGKYREESESLKIYNDNYNSKTVRLSRDEIINQLIKNRVQFYLKVKELEGFGKDEDLNVRLGRRILNYLESKNYSLARELFKVFVAQKQQNKTQTKSTKIVKTTPKGMFMTMKEPLIQFENGKAQNMGTDMFSLTKALMKQLTNIKNMRS